MTQNKTLILENATEFSGTILLIEPQFYVDSVKFVNDSTFDITPKIYFGSDRTKMVSVRDYICYQDMNAVLHESALEILFKKHPQYFDKVHEFASKEKFVISNTYVFEAPDYHGKFLFPETAQELYKKIGSQKITMDMYEKLYQIEGFKMYIEKYFKGICSIIDIINLYNFGASHNGPCANFLERYVATYVAKFNEENIDDPVIFIS